MCCSPKRGTKISAALAARRIPVGAGFAELGCIIVKMTLKTLIKNTETKEISIILCYILILNL